MKLKGIGQPHFVCPEDHIWPELVGNSVAELAPQTLQARCVNGLDCWITRTYYELRRAGFDATIGPSLSPSAVNIAGALPTLAVGSATLVHLLLYRDWTDMIRSLPILRSIKMD
jgi:hypothetical protein